MKLESSLKKILLASSLSSLLIGCGATTAEPQTQELTQAQQEEERLTAAAVCEEDPELIEHACYHGEYGPFVTVAAAAPGSTVIPNVNAPHTAFNITLPQNSTYGYTGSVTFRPPETGEYAFLLSRFRAFTLYDGNTVVARECSAFIDEASCSSLKRQVMADLEEGKVYRLEFQALFPQNAAFTLVIEEGHHEHEEE